MRTLLLSPRTPTSLCTPVAAFGFTDWIGLVCALWLAPVDWRGAVCATAAVVRAAKTAAAITLMDCLRIMCATPLMKDYPRGGADFVPTPRYGTYVPRGREPCRDAKKCAAAVSAGLDVGSARHCCYSSLP